MTMMIIEIIQYSLAILVGGLLGYQLLLSFLAFRGKKIHSFVSSRNRKFAIVLPAHNDEKVISRSLYSLSGLVYPKNMYDLIVIADNCSDKSAVIADKLGAIVLERSNEQELGKGYALRWAFEQILQWNENYDAIIIFNSDSLVSGNYLEVMNYYLDQGSEVIQSSDLVLPQPNVWSTEAMRIRYLLYNYVKPMGRKVLGLGMGLRCNGMCFSTDILSRIPWQSWSLTREIEYGLVIQLEGINIDFAPEAEIWSQMRDQAGRKISRSEKGRYAVLAKYAPKLLAAFIKKRSLKYLDVLVNLMTPPLVNMLLFISLMCSVNAIGWGMGWGTVSFFWTWTALGGAGIIYLLVGLAAAGADRQLFKSMLYIPRYIFWRLRGKPFSSEINENPGPQPAREKSEALPVDD